MKIGGNHLAIIDRIPADKQENGLKKTTTTDQSPTLEPMDPGQDAVLLSVEAQIILPDNYPSSDNNTVYL